MRIPFNENKISGIILKVPSLYYALHRLSRTGNDKFVNQTALDAFRAWTTTMTTTRRGVGVRNSRGRRSMNEQEVPTIVPPLLTRHVLSTTPSLVGPTPPPSPLHTYFLILSLALSLSLLFIPSLPRSLPPRILLTTESSSYRGSVLSPSSALLSVSFLPCVARARPFGRIGLRVAPAFRLQPQGPETLDVVLE